MMSWHDLDAAFVIEPDSGSLTTKLLGKKLSKPLSI